MKVLLTGASGFIGSHFVKESAGTFDVISTSRKTANPHQAVDLNQIESVDDVLKRNSPNALVHLAWEGLPDYSAAMNLKNLTISTRLIDAAIKAGVKSLLIAGTCWEYGNVTGIVKETDPARQPVNLFAAYKRALCEIAMAQAAAAGVKLIWVRPFFIYGPGQRSTSLIPSSVGALSRGETLNIRTPKISNDFIHVRDVAKALMMLLNPAVDAGIYNIGSGSPTFVYDVCNRIALKMGLPLPFAELAEKAGKILAANSGMYADVSKMEAATNWRPLIKLDEALDEIIKCP